MLVSNGRAIAPESHNGLMPNAHVVVPGGSLAFQMEAAFGGVGFVGANQVQHRFLEQREVLWGGTMESSSPKLMSSIQ